MLERISIRNYVIIESQEIVFSGGLNIITGDTGAGKSIILDALTLVLGSRAESRVLLNPEKKAVVEATFANYPKQLDRVLSEHDVDLSNEIIMRREILPSGKSRAFVNDTPVRLDFMRSISGYLIDLHQQFETLEIQQRDLQYDVLDAYAGLQNQVRNYRDLFSKHSALSARVNRLTEERARAAQERDYVEYQLTELNEFLPQPGELQEWEDVFSLQSNAEEIRNLLMSTTAALRDDDRAIIDVLKHFATSLNDYSAREVSALGDRIHSVATELEDVAADMAALESNFDPDPELKAELEEKIDGVRRLFLKHGIQTEQELIDLAESFQQRLDGWEEIGADLDKAIAERDQTLNDLKELGTILYQARTKYAPPLLRK